MAEEAHETKIVISGDAKNAVGAFSSVGAAIKKVGSEINAVVKFFSRLNWAISAITNIVTAVKNLTQGVARAKEAAERLREKLRDRAMESSIESVANAYKKVKDAIEDATNAQKRSLELIDREVQSRRDLEIAKLNAAEQKELDAVDANAPDADYQRQAIAAEYAKRRSTYESSNRVEDLVLERQKITKSAEVLERESQAELEHARALRKQAEAVLKESQLEAAKSVAENGKDASGFWGNFGNNVKNIVKLDWNRVGDGRTEAGDAERGRHGQKSEELMNKADELEKQAQAAEQTARRKSEEAAGKRKIAEGMGGTIEAAKINQNTQDAKSAAKVRAVEQAEDQRLAEEDRKKQEEADRNKAKRIAEENREKTKRANDLEAFASRIDAADGVSGNRLTAMGLGSGVSAKGGVASDVRKLVELVRQDVEANKKSAEQSVNQNNEMVLGE